MNKWHPYVARIPDGRPISLIGLSRARARKWDVEFLVKARVMLTSNVLYRHIQSYNDNPLVMQRVYLQRVSFEEFDLLRAFAVPCVSGTKFTEEYMGQSLTYINEDGGKVIITSREIHDGNEAGFR